MSHKTVPTSLKTYAEKFGVAITTEKHGFYGDDWDYVVEPANRSHYPSVSPVIMPAHGVEAGRMAIRIVAGRMDTGEEVAGGFRSK